MAKSLRVFTNGYVAINGVVLSDHVESLQLEVDVNAVEVTAMGDGGKNYLAGLQDSKLTITFWQDFSASEVDPTLWGCITGGTAVSFKVGANGTAFSATNPSYSGSAICTKYPPFSGKVGDGLQTAVEFTVCGTVTSGTS